MGAHNSSEQLARTGVVRENLHLLFYAGRYAPRERIWQTAKNLSLAVCQSILPAMR